MCPLYASNFPQSSQQFAEKTVVVLTQEVEQTTEVIALNILE